MSEQLKDTAYNAGFSIYCQTALHAGSGAVLSHVDLPIQREVHTGHPVVYASGWKGALREHCGKAEWVIQLFGSEPAGQEGASGATSAGSGIFQELRLLLFPVRSFKEVFVWVTCPLVLQRAALHLNGTVEKVPEWPLADFGINTAWFDEKLGIGQDKNMRLCIEDYDFAPASTADAETLAVFETFREGLANMFVPVPADPTDLLWKYWHDAVQARIVVLSDHDFANMVALHTQIETHVQIKEDGTVGGGPWNQESLPADTVLYTAVRIPAVLEGKGTPSGLGAKLEEQLAKPLAVGGDRSLGKGWVKVTRLEVRDASHD